MAPQRAGRHLAHGLMRSLTRLLPCSTLALAFVLLVAACGQSSVSNEAVINGAAATPPAATATAMAAAAGTPASPSIASGQKATSRGVEGCSTALAPADAAAFTPDVVVSQTAQETSAPQPVTLARGQRLEIRLSPADSWELSATGMSSILVAVNPQGWYDGGARACIWRFTAQGAGSAQLTFVGAAVCPFLRLCPSVEQTVTYAVTVR
jgi:hypothetical protein